MRRMGFLLSLIAALSGTLLRQAEGADDLTRSVAELGSRTHVETADGGVGDDSGVTLEAGSFQVSVELAVAMDLPSPFPGHRRPSGPCVSRRVDLPSHPPAGSPRSHALLQIFLF